MEKLSRQVFHYYSIKGKNMTEAFQSVEDVTMTIYQSFMESVVHCRGNAVSLAIEMLNKYGNESPESLVQRLESSFPWLAWAVIKQQKLL